MKSLPQRSNPGPKIGIILNHHAGAQNSHSTIQKALQAHQESIILYTFDKKHTLESAVRNARQQGCTTIVAAGGDGTVSAVASAIIKQKILAKLGVLPLGTLNHFARDIGMPKNIEAGIEIILKGNSTFIDIVKMNDTFFINNSSLGIYPFMVKERDLIKRRGVRKWWRMVKASMTTLKRHPFISVEFKAGTKKFIRRTPFIFIGNNSYSIEAGKFGMRQKLDEGILTVFLAHEVTRRGMLGLAWHALRGKLIEQKGFDSIGVSKIKITSHHKKLTVSHDGEISKIRTPISYSILPKALHVIIP